MSRCLVSEAACSYTNPPYRAVTQKVTTKRAVHEATCRYLVTAVAQHVTGEIARTG